MDPEAQTEKNAIIKDEENNLESTNNNPCDEDIANPNPPSFWTELSKLITRISSLSATIDISLNAVEVAYKKTANEYKNFEKENIKVSREEGKTTIYIKADCAQEFWDFQKKMSNFAQALETLPRSYVMSLVSEYDAFLGRLIRVIFLIKPEMLNSSERNLTFSQLIEFGSIEDAREYIIEREIDSVIRESHTKQFQWMETKFGLPLRKGLTVWPDFIEVTERRNLFVHTGGIVSTQYMKVCKENCCDLKDIVVGDELSVSQQYFRHAYYIIFEIAFKLSQVLWRKFMPEDLEAADNNLVAIGFDTLYDEQFGLAKMIFDFSADILKKYSNDETRRIMVINRAQAYKWSGDEKRARAIIDNEDWSSQAPKFKLARAVLLDEFEVVYALMKELGPNSSEMKANYYRE